MKLKMKTISAVAALALAAAAQTNTGMAQTPGGAGVEVSPEVYGFGDVDGGAEVLRGRFALRNCGTDSLRVENAVPDCHCTKVEWSGEAAAPGDSCFVSFEYRRDAYTESFRKSIKVFTNRSSEPLTLYFMGTFVESASSLAQKYPFAHGALGMESGSVSLGRIYMGESGTEIVRLANLSGSEVEVEVGECQKGVSAEMLKKKIAPLGEGFMRIRVESGDRWGWNEFSVTPEVDGKAVEPIRVRAMVVPDFRDADEQRQREGPYPLFERKRVALEATEGQAVASAKLSMQNLSDEQMTIYAVQTLNPRFSIDFPGRVAANATVSLGVSLDASGLEPGEYYEKMYLITNSPAAPVTEIDIVYIIR